MSENSTPRRRKKRKSNLSYVLEIILCLISLTAIGFAMVFLVKYHQAEERADRLQSLVDVYEDPEDPYIERSKADEMVITEHDLAYAQGREEARGELLESIKSNLLATNSSVDTLKIYYPDDLILVHENKFYFFPISDDLKHHPYQSADFTTADNGRIVYTGTTIPTETWIDVSKYQSKIKWDKVADDGIDGAIIRMGYRGYSKGDIMPDDTFEYNIEGALDNGLKAGVYFLTQATSDSEAREEAEYVTDHLKDYDIEGPVVLDVELVGGDDGRGNALPIEDRTQYAITFLEAIREAGYEALIYGNLKTFLLMLDMSRLEDYDKWFAGYTATPYFPYEMDMWQYTDTGSVSGVSGDVDINIRFLR